MALSSWVLLLVVAVSAAFVAATGGGMPDVVASHFAAGGRADGFMSRDGYVTFMVAMMLGMAAVFAGLPKLLRRLPSARFNLPNREFWLAPERRQATLDDIERRMRWLACALLLFIAYVHWLVVDANSARPPVLAEGAFLAGMGCFLGVVVAWAIAFHRRFRRAGS